VAARTAAENTNFTATTKKNVVTTNTPATFDTPAWTAERQAILDAMRRRRLDFAMLGRQLGVAGSTIRSAVYKRKQPARPRLLATLRSWLHEVREVTAPADAPFRGPSANGAGTTPHTGHASGTA
jgi:hypothetical protein